MSADRKLFIPLSVLMLAGTACGTAAGIQGPQKENTPIVTSGRFTSTQNNILSDLEMKVIVPDGSGFVYIARFYAPKPTSADDFTKYGRTMLDGIKINGLPTK